MSHDSGTEDLRDTTAQPPGPAAADEMEDSLQAEGFEEGDAYDEDMGEEAFAADEPGDPGADPARDSGADDVDDFDAGMAAQADALEVWNAFEQEIADGLDAPDTGEFIARVLGGLGRAASAVSRGQAAGAVGSVSEAATTLARVLGAQHAAGRAGDVPDVASPASGSVPGRPASKQGHLLAHLGRWMGNELDDVAAFGAAADLYVDQGLDEALPATVALAARAVSRGLGLRNVAHLTLAERCALVRAIGTSARELILGRGPQAVRALPRMGGAVVRTARRRHLTPGATAQAVRSALPRTARNVARSPQLMRRLATPAAGPRPIARPTGIGRGTPGAGFRAHRFTFSGPVTLNIRRPLMT